MRRRTLILIFGLPIYTFALMVIGSAGFLLIAIDNRELVPDIPSMLVDAIGEGDWWSFAGISAVVVVALQAVFLIPMFNRRPPRERRGKSLTASLFVAGFFAGLLMMGLGGGAMELIGLLAGRRPGEGDAYWLLPFGALAVGWTFWTVMLILYVRGIWADRTLGRIVGILLAGTVLEALVVLPIDIMVRRKTDCYCATGTFISLTICGLGALWLAGPGVVIALLSGKHRRWREVYCANCGYAKGPSPGPRCAECGRVWETDRERRRNVTTTEKGG